VGDAVACIFVFYDLYERHKSTALWVVARLAGIRRLQTFPKKTKLPERRVDGKRAREEESES